MHFLEKRFIQKR